MPRYAIETRITDETIKLYGFSSAAEREWFRLLQTVQNVGARVALAVLSALSPRDLEKALALSDKAAIGRAQGVGPKLATRIVTELKDKAPAMMLRGGAEPAEVHAAFGRPRGPRPMPSRPSLKLGYAPGPCRRNGGPRRPRPGRGRPGGRADPRSLEGGGAVTYSLTSLTSQLEAGDGQESGRVQDAKAKFSAGYPGGRERAADDHPSRRGSRRAAVTAGISSDC